MEKHYPEIEELKLLVGKYSMSVEVVFGEFLAEKSYFPKIVLYIGSKSFSFFADDEYNDLALEHPILSVCIALRSLEDYDYAEDYLVWCTQHNFDAANLSVRDHFQHLGEVYKQVHEILGEVDSKVSDYDFELNAGAAQLLRNSDS